MLPDKGFEENSLFWSCERTKQAKWTAVFKMIHSLRISFFRKQAKQNVFAKWQNRNMVKCFARQ
jgi:hypothetical protein